MNIHANNLRNFTEIQAKALIIFPRNRLCSSLPARSSRYRGHQGKREEVADTPLSPDMAGEEMACRQETLCIILEDF